MRPDIVPGALFPDYALTDHTAKHRKLSELQGQHPMVLILSRGGYIVRRTGARPSCWSSSIVKWRWDTAAWSRSAQTTSR